MSATDHIASRERKADREVSLRSSHGYTLFCQIRFWSTGMQIANFTEAEQLEPGRIAAALRTSAEEMAMRVGLGKDALQRRTRIGSDKTQRRLRELVEILHRVEPRFGSALIAYAWYRSEPLAGFDGRTAMQLVQDGKAQQVLECINAVDAGVFA